MKNSWTAVRAVDNDQICARSIRMEATAYSGVDRAADASAKILYRHVGTARHSKIGIRNFCVRRWFDEPHHANSWSSAFASLRSSVSNPSAMPYVLVSLTFIGSKILES